LLKEIRLHSRGGQGAVKAAQLVVESVVTSGGYAHFIPFFGVERKGSPVFGFLRIDDKDIRLKCQIYTPDVLIIMDDSLLSAPKTFEGMKDGAVVVLNTVKPLGSLGLPTTVGTVATVDATGIALEKTGNTIPNTSMLGAFAKATGMVDWENLKKHILKLFGQKNLDAAEHSYNVTVVHKGGVS